MRRTPLRALVVLTTAATLASAPTAALAGRSKPSVDRTAPGVLITSPAPGATVAEPFTVTGTASDNRQLSRVTVSLDNGAAVTASGTTSWSWTSGAVGAGSHAITVTAVDTSGNASTTTRTVTVATSGGSSTSPGDLVLSDPRATYDLALLGRGRMAERAGLSALLYGEQFTARKGALFRDGAAGATSYVDLPTPSTEGWWNPTAVLTSATDLWVLGGQGPILLRHYALSGGALPSSATLVSTQVFGNSDSRPGDLLLLDSGALVAVWNQQGHNAEQYLSVAYRSPAGAWSQVPPLTFMPTSSSKQIAVQHPADGSVWVFSDPDAWAATGAVHLTETSTGLRVDWTHATYLAKNTLGEVGPEGENPDLAAAPDPTSGTIALAYQAAHTQLFSTSPFVKGAYVTLARIPATGPVSFQTLPTFVERIACLALSVSGDATWLSYRPVDQAALTYDRLQAVRSIGGVWGEPRDLGRLATGYEPLTYTSGTPQVSARMSDGKVHLFRL